MAEKLALLGVVLSALSGVPGFFLPRETPRGQKLANALLLLGAVAGLCGAIAGFLTPGGALDLGGASDGLRLKLHVDSLSAFFLIPVFLIPSLCSIYGLDYWPQARHQDNGVRLRFFFGLVQGFMALLVVAANTLLFLMAWEVMTLAAFFLVTTEEDDAKVRLAGWHYLVATHVGILALIALFALLRSATGSFDFGPVGPGVLTPDQGSAIFLLALVGFGLKAGLMPFHVWLPGAHASAPSHVSAIMSGVLLKMGVFGMIRLTGWLDAPPLWWGEVTLALGVISAVAGVLFALGQHDIKRLLAYHSIENIGLIFMGLGLALMGRSSGRADWVALGMAGALLHTLNHGLFKSLLFLGAGSVIHATGTREIDRMGGLAKRMPFTAATFLLGSVAICGLPPLNGFVSELFLYLGLFSAALGKGGAIAGPAFAAPALALTGALALACFVKVYGAVFLGEPRKDEARTAHEATAAMTAPMVVLGVLCAVIGLLPFLFAGMLEAVSKAAMPGALHAPPLASLAPLVWVSAGGAALLLLVALLALWTRRSFVRRRPTFTTTWDCGYAAPSARMQYTASSFASSIIDAFDWILNPRERKPKIEGYFPKTASYHNEVPDLVLDRALTPGWQRLEEFVGRFRVIQQGQLQFYILYILAALLALLFWK